MSVRGVEVHECERGVEVHECERGVEVHECDIDCDVEQCGWDEHLTPHPPMLQAKGEAINAPPHPSPVRIFFWWQSYL